jgi:ligand-binding sensor domain-containing protein
VWVGTHWGGLAYRNVSGQWMIFDETGYHSHLNANETIVNYKYKLPTSEVTTLLSDSHEGLWIGTVKGLAYRHVNNELTVYDPEQTALPINWGSALARDSLGGLWIGTPWSGLVQYTATGEWKYYNPDDFGLPTPDGISSLLSDNQGGLWIGSGVGLAYRSVNGKWTVYQSELPNHFIQVLESDGNNGLWIGTSGGGVIHRNGDLTVYSTDNSGLPTNYVRALATDESGGLWIGVENAEEQGQGLAYRSANGEWSIYHTNNSELPHNEVSALLSDGGLWVGFLGEGGLAYRSLTGEWTTYNTKTSELPDNNVVALVRDNDGLWIGTQEGGIAYRSTRGEWTVYNSDNSGLPNNSIKAIESDGTGGIWEVGSQGGGLAHLSFGQKNALCTEINQADCQSLLTGKRAAIIIAGGGNDLTNTLWDTTEAISNYIYKLLNKRGFLNEEIYYLSPKSWADFNGDGLNDRIVDAPNDRPLTVQDIREALQWAKTRGQLDQPLYLFFIDHGGTDRFQLGKLSYMSAAEFKTILDDYQSQTGNQIVLVIDTCYSGSLMQKLIAPNRAIISSTGNGLAYFDRLQKQGFSRFLASGLLKGMNFFEAFQYASQKQKKMLGNLSQGTTTDLNIIQEPQLEDGQGGQWLRQLFLNGPFVTADLTLAVEGVTTSTTLSASQSLNIKAQVGFAQGKVIRVWAILIPPKANLVMDSNGTPILAYPRLQLSQTQDETIWETTWRGGVYNGDYEFTFYAEDNQGNIASSDNSVVISVTGGVEPPSQATVQMVVAQEKYRAGEQFKAQLIENLGWGYDLFAAVVLPDGNFIAFKNTNQLAALNEATKWRGQRVQNAPLTLIDLTLPNLPKGQYCLYGILSPEKEDVFETLNQGLWVMVQKCFEILQ